MNKTCTINGCNNTHKAKGLCRKHYTRLLVHGSPDAVLVSHDYHGMSGLPEYRIWNSMRQRCNNPHSKAYRYYGGRGIQLYEPWAKSFRSFIESVGRRPSTKHTIDRINNDGNYEPNNVRWATMLEQSWNKKLTVNNVSGYKGVSKKRNKWAAYIRAYNISTYLGAFKTCEEAALAYDAAAIQVHGEYANLNII